MTRRRVAVLAVIAALLVTLHAPAVVGQTSDGLVVGNQHTDFGTGDEPPPQLQNLTITGSGESATVSLGQLSESLSRNADDGSTTSISTRDGLKIQTESDISSVSIQLSSQTQDATKAYVMTTDGTVLASSQINSAEATIDVELSAGAAYYVVVDAEGASYTRGQTSSPGFPVDGQLFDITSGVYDATSSDPGEFGTAYNILSIDAKSGSKGSHRYVSAAHDVSGAEQAAINITQASNVSIDAEVRTDGGTTIGSGTITSTGNHTISLSDTSSSQLETVLDVTVTGSNPQFELADESILFENDAPTVDNSSASPGGGETLQTAPPTLSIDVSDAQIGTAQGDSLTVEWFVDGQSVGTTTTGQNGTVSYELGSIDGGNHTWHAEVTDSYGATATTDTFSFAVPDELRVYKETKPSELVTGDNLSLRVRFFSQGTDEVIERQVVDGTVDLSGLPADQRYIVTVRANDTDQFTYRRIVVDSLIETQEVYLLNRSVPNSEVIFQLDDPTGQFPPENTTLYVEKAIAKDFDGDGNDTTRYQVIAGDTFGASGGFPVVLQTDERYRIRVETDDESASRILGAYTVYGDVIETLQIERVAPDSDAQTGASLRAGVEDRNGDDWIAIRYTDPGKETVEVQYEVVNENGTVVVPNTTRETDSFADLYPEPANASDDAVYEVRYHVVRESGEFGGVDHIGSLGAIADRFGVDPQVMSIISWLAILCSMGLVVVIDETVAPLVGVAVAAALTILGTVGIPMVALGLAGAVAVLVRVGGGR